MVEFLRTSKISSHIEDIIVDAKEHITFVTPYLKFTKTLYERLVEKDDEGVKIRFIYGKVKLQDDQEQLLRRLKNISIYFLENLHAKCYINEFAGIVTSMNLYDFSEKNNREMGIFFKRTDNESLYTQVNAEVESIIKAATLLHNKASHTSHTQVINAYNSQQNPKNDEVKPTTSLTYNQRLIEKLRAEYKYCTFEYILRDDSILCNDFNEFYRLEVEPKGSYYRINFQITGDQNRSFFYDILFSHKYEIEKHFPRDVVFWGNQMKRVKFDFPQNTKQMSKMDEQIYLNWVKSANLLLEDILNTELRKIKSNSSQSD